MIVWILSHPRSGAEYVRLILETVFHCESYVLDNVYYDSRLERMCNPPPLPDSIAGMRGTSVLYFLKTNAAFSDSDDRFSPNDGYLYVVRDGRDVAISLANYRHDVEGDTRPVDEITAEILSSRTWAEHVLGWVRAKRKRMRVLPFEEFMAPLADAPKLVEKAMQGLGIELGDRVRPMPAYTEYNAKAPRFFRHGFIGEWRDTLGLGDARSFIDRNRDALVLGGYTQDEGSPEKIVPVPCARTQSGRLLDILVCTLADRIEQFEKLRSKLQAQIDVAGLSKVVKIVVECDGGERPIGEKRNRLMRRARAEYVCYVDDDDTVSNDYVRRIVEALGDCDVDCVGITGEMEHPIGRTRRFVHSTRYKAYVERGEIYERPPNHLNPVRRVIASQFPFKEIDHGEDTDYAIRMLRTGVLKTERVIETPIYFYLPSCYQRATPAGGRR